MLLRDGVAGVSNSVCTRFTHQYVLGLGRTIVACHVVDEQRLAHHNGVWRRRRRDVCNYVYTVSENRQV